jgi:hypothetical protein
VKREAGIRNDLWATAVLTGVLLACVAFGAWDGLLGAVIGVLVVLTARISHRHFKRRAPPVV